MSTQDARAEAPLLEVRDLGVELPSPESLGMTTVVDGVSFSVARGEAVALLGESGAGKSVTTSALMGLLPEGARTRGRVNFDGRDLLALDERSLRGVRGRRIGLVFQEPAAALNPMYSARWHVTEAVTLAGRRPRSETKSAAQQLLARVGFPRGHQDAYPHELSGGMKQRLMIAIALAGEPELLIADEPTTALDVIAAAEIRALLGELRTERQLALLVISHDIGMVAEVAQRTLVMYAGQVIEHGPTREVLDSPRHPYTRSLLDCLPRPGLEASSNKLRRLTEIPQADGVPTKGCRFAPRCRRAKPECHAEQPSLDDAASRAARCFFPLEGADR